MNGKPKRDARKIIQYFDELKRASWIGRRFWWPDFLFHVTDIKNVVSILNSGFMFSRSQLELRSREWEDAASQKVINQTDSRLTDYVRFYFRPLTPTAYRNEGFKPAPQLYHNAHCPVPIYLLFDLKLIMSLQETRFSAGSLARQDYTLYRNAEDLPHLSFKDIYHNLPFSRNEKSHIVNARQAEVIFPERLSLYSLKFICCRSQAEYDTLRNLLSPVNWNKWKSKVRFRNHHLLFNRRWLHVRDATLTRNHIVFNFHPPTETQDCGPFNLRVDINDNWSRDNYYFDSEYENIVSELSNLRLELDLSETNLRDYSVTLTIDDKLAYSGNYTDDTIPF